MVKNCPFCPLPYLPFSSWKSVLGILSEILFACTGQVLLMYVCFCPHKGLSF